MRPGSIFGLLLILVILPLGALYYMNMGMKWRMERLEELKAYSQLSEDQLRAAYDSLAPVFLDEENIIVTSFINADDAELSRLFGKHLQKLHQQFDARADVFFVSHVHGERMSPASFLSSFRETYQMEDTAQCRFLWDDRAQLASLAESGYQLERTEQDDWVNNPYFALVDSATVRRYYDVRQPREVQRLVEHIAILIPPSKEREDLVFKRETEK